MRKLCTFCNFCLLLSNLDFTAPGDTVFLTGIRKSAIPFDLMNQRSKKFVPNYIIHKIERLSFAGIFLDKNLEEYNIRVVGVGAIAPKPPPPPDIGRVVNPTSIKGAHHITAPQLPPDFQAFLQRYTYRVLQTIQMKLILLCIWAERAVLGSAKTALKFKYEI